MRVFIGWWLLAGCFVGPADDDFVVVEPWDSAGCWQSTEVTGLARIQEGNVQAVFSPTSDSFRIDTAQLISGGEAVETTVEPEQAVFSVASVSDTLPVVVEVQVECAGGGWQDPDVPLTWRFEILRTALTETWSTLESTSVR